MIIPNKAILKSVYTEAGREAISGYVHLVWPDKPDNSGMTEPYIEATDGKRLVRVNVTMEPGDDLCNGGDIMIPIAIIENATDIIGKTKGKGPFMVAINPDCYKMMSGATFPRPPPSALPQYPNTSQVWPELNKVGVASCFNPSFLANMIAALGCYGEELALLRGNDCAAPHVMEGAHGKAVIMPGQFISADKNESYLPNHAPAIVTTPNPEDEYNVALAWRVNTMIRQFMDGYRHGVDTGDTIGAMGADFRKQQDAKREEKLREKARQAK